MLEGGRNTADIDLRWRQINILFIQHCCGNVAVGLQGRSDMHDTGRHKACRREHGRDEPVINDLPYCK